MGYPCHGLGRILSVIGLCLASLASTGLSAAGDKLKVTPGIESAPYIVVFDAPPVAIYATTSAGLAALPRFTTASGRTRINMQSPAVDGYVASLRSQQLAYEALLSSALGRTLSVRHRMQHAVNAVVIDMSDGEAASALKMAGVKLVEPYREYAQDTDTGPALIGTPSVWDASFTGYIGSVRGEGMVIGVIDSGINFGSPSFAEVDPLDGYKHVNPLRAGTYLGTCAPGGDDAGRCNAKLIGGYDFVCGAPGNVCNLANVREEPGFGDTNGHGTHTASTAAGNNRNVTIDGAPRTISGVAPRANVIAYDVCYTNTSTGLGSCPNTSLVAGINQAVADGIVDVINYSISGGTDPWTETTSLALKGAVAAGIYVATSAGNSGPAAGTVGHLEPWTAATAAAQHGRGQFATRLNITGPAPVPVNVAQFYLSAATGGVAFTATLPGTTPLRVSSGYATTSDGCAAYPANTFAGVIALLRRGTCTSTIKVNNAVAAGAVAVIIANNAAGDLIPSVPGTTVPTFGMTQTNGDLLKTFLVANPTATAELLFPQVAQPNTVDALGSFSARGPAGGFDLIKPDVTAPGVAILAAVSGTTLTGSEQAVALYDGTSMASPHNAGAALLIRQARPTWTVAEVKSAIMLTAKQSVLLEDQTTPANAFASGSGRIRVDRAVTAALVLDETDAGYAAANPAIGGDPAALNLPSIARSNCFLSCTFTRTFRNTRASSVQWQASNVGLTGTISPSSFTVAPGATQTVTITINTSAQPRDGSWRFGWLELKEVLGPGVFNEGATLNLPIALAIQPAIASVPSSLAVSVKSAGVGTLDMDLFNIGGSPLTFALTSTGTGFMNTYRALSTGISSGFRSITYTDPATAGSAGQYSADNFTLVQTTRLTKVTTEGFVVSGAPLTSAAVQIVWSVFPDAAGVPAGDPLRSPASAAWTYTATPTSPGVTVTSNAISLDLATAGQTPSLPAGSYWLVVNTRGTFANRWAQYGSISGDGAFSSLTVLTNNTGAWITNNSLAGLAMQIDGAVACGATWFGPAFPNAGTVLPQKSQRLTAFINAGSLPAATYRGSICASTDAVVRPVVAVPVTLTVTP